MRRFAKWAVSGAGLLLVVCGLGAMATGWDQILIERGWSLFIAGATFVAGGAVTASLGVLIGRLDALNRSAIVLPGGAEKRLTPPAAAAKEARDDRKAESAEATSPKIVPAEEATAAAVQEVGEATEEAAPTVIDHYESGGASYVMYSDGSVDVQTEYGVRRYASLAELRSNMDA
jgi:hypothetical protein